MLYTALAAFLAVAAAGSCSDQHQAIGCIDTLVRGEEGWAFKHGTANRVDSLADARSSCAGYKYVEVECGGSVFCFNDTPVKNFLGWDKCDPDTAPYSNDCPKYVSTAALPLPGGHATGVVYFVDPALNAQAHSNDECFLNPNDFESAPTVTDIPCNLEQYLSGSWKCKEGAKKYIYTPACK